MLISTLVGKENFERKRELVYPRFLFVVYDVLCVLADDKSGWSGSEPDRCG